jgi:hypothetical protein
VVEYTTISPPVAGAYRVHPAPELLPLAPRPGEPGRNRFDDPEGEFRVRYLASTLRGCCVELLARWQDDQVAENHLAEVEGLDEFDDLDLPDPAKIQGVRDWAVKQKVVRCMVDNRELLIDIDSSELLVDLDKHALVRKALEESPLGSETRRAHLDHAVIRLTGRVGRPITQAVSRAVREMYPLVRGLAYWSRIDDNERCWAVYQEAPVRFSAAERLDPANPLHRDAMRSAASLLQVTLPPEW